LHQHYQKTFASALREFVSIHLNLEFGLQALMTGKFHRQDSGSPTKMRLIAVLDPPIKRNSFESGIERAVLGQNRPRGA
jgi:hypothetical protein